MGINKLSIRRLACIVVVFLRFSINPILNVNAGLTVKPLWNVNDTDIQNGAEFCGLRAESTYGYNLFTLSSQSTQLCGVQVKPVRSGTVIQISKLMSSEETFLYVEKQGDIGNCENRYVVIQGYEPCSTWNKIFWNTDLQIFLQGNTSVGIRDVSVPNKSSSICEAEVGVKSEDNEEPRPFKGVIETTFCPVTEYNHTMTCLSLGQVCLFERFPADCNNTLGNRHVHFICPEESPHSSHKALLLYPNDIVALDLAWQNINAISSHAFVNLNRLLALYLDFNGLTTLHSESLTGLTKLIDLYLYYNNLQTLHRNLFDGLVSLSLLHLHSNKLTYLPDGLFKNCKQLTVLSLSSNLLSSIDGNLLKETTQLSHLYLYNNQLTSLDAKLLNETTELTLLNLDRNQLTSLDPNLLRKTTKLTALYLNVNQLTTLDVNLLIETTDLVAFSIDTNQVKSVHVNLFKMNTKLDYLILLNNKLTYLPKHMLDSLLNLRMFSAAYNQLTDIPYDLFLMVTYLQILDLGSNFLRYIDRITFQGLHFLEHVYLYSNQMSSLHHQIFEDNVNLRFLDLSRNQLKNIPNMDNLKQLQFFALHVNSLISIHTDSFLFLSNHSELFVSQAEICECFVPAYANCTALDVRSPYLTCDRLLSNKVLMVMMWLIGLSALCGNLFVLIRRKTNNQGYNVQSVFLSNLAMSDLLMGIYLLIIACADIFFDDSFPMNAERWRSGITCRITGAISMLSSEASVFFITLISIDRFINMRFPDTQRKISKVLSIIIAALVWFITLVLVIVPSVLAGRYYKLYDVSHVCIGLPLANNEFETKEIVRDRTVLEDDTLILDKYKVTSKSEGLVPGLYYASALFLGLNGFCYFVILVCYVEIVRAVYKSSKRVGRSKEVRKSHMKMNVKVAAIVLTDFLCWSPIIILGILIQTDVLTLSESVFAWIVVVVLPINSAVNPYLYTIVDLICRRKQAQSRGRNENQQEIAQRQTPDKQITPLDTILDNQEKDLNIGKVADAESLSTGKAKATDTEDRNTGKVTDTKDRNTVKVTDTEDRNAGKVTVTKDFNKDKAIDTEH